MTYTVFGVDGGEAIDLAIKVARGYTGKVKLQYQYYNRS